MRLENIKMFQTTPRIIMGPGSLARVVDEINRIKCKKIMIITDTGLVEAGIFGKLENLLKAAGINFSKFGSVKEKPPPP